MKVGGGPRAEDDQPAPRPSTPKRGGHSLRIAPARGKVVPFPTRRGPSRRLPPPPSRGRFRLAWIWVGLIVIALVIPYIWHG